MHSSTPTQRKNRLFVTSPRAAAGEQWKPFRRPSTSDGIRMGFWMTVGLSAFFFPLSPTASPPLVPRPPPRPPPAPSRCCSGPDLRRLHLRRCGPVGVVRDGGTWFHRCGPPPQAPRASPVHVRRYRQEMGIASKDSPEYHLLKKVRRLWLACNSSPTPHDHRPSAFPRCRVRRDSLIHPAPRNLPGS